MKMIKYKRAPINPDESVYEKMRVGKMKDAEKVFEQAKKGKIIRLF